MKEFSRTKLLFGEENLGVFKKTRVAVIGLGGVGSYAVEVLARSGIGKLRLVDFDKITKSNINRQVIALHSTIGRLKTEVMAERIKDINPSIEVEIATDFCDENNREKLLKNLDFVIDAIDSLGPKAGLMADLYHRKIPFISVLGAAGKIDPSLIELTDISKTKICPLARKVRKYLHRKDIYKISRLFIRLRGPYPNLLLRKVLKRTRF